MNYRSLAVLSFVSVALSGCAQKQFVKGHGLAPSETVYIVTAPTGATASTNYGQSCTTPCYLPLLRAKGGEVTVAMDGHHTERFTVTSSVSDARIARRAASNAVEAIDPDPVSILLTAAAQLADGKGGVMSLDERDFVIEMRPLEDGEEDLLAPAEPITGERIPIDISETATE
ncbi:hypothetical protein [Erythrobacter ani]|uniref:Lipoprotein n=1 Tax=Erythrobacter ani TaxID=2827235 RepID=A0ABS6SRN2_9SPHN|nr:hypothetical protein [Erythrobacter ani]MBV7267038.1 hypothetical protein [Erythrobacter ani]